MTIEVHVLGTSSARPAQGRSVSGSIVETQNGMFVVDCGEGFQNRLVDHRSAMKAYGGRRLKMSKVAAILLTHGHLDHTWGVLPWLQTLALDGRKDPLWVIGPTTSEVVETLLGGENEPEVSPSDLVIQYDMWIDLGANSETLGYELVWVLGDGTRWVNMNDGSEIELPQPMANTTISAHATQHTVPSVAWKISTSDRKGKFNRNATKDMPIDVISSLAAGEDCEYEGQLLKAADFRSSIRPGGSVIISGDTAEQAIDAECDLLIHEATFLEEHSDIANEHLHSSAGGAARTANECKAQHLALTHYSARLEDHTASLDEAREIHPSVVALSDGDRLQLLDDNSLNHFVKSSAGWTQQD
ncbi:MAG: MBL fold metallo-hydrolase [Euryarchaeota archaeon]|nr:MBL fold metallo-hydrolase [Euryarchaeota archaeon]MBT4982438.1 MBL fold metallo-hydrolase [Euryarchaeota archaeon]MBT5185049.1 MBL fold metallo-hydrolase [Euryarchaeota archaeon]